jgi:DNA-binding LacI/PurR family transcriptional regulator
LIGKQAGEVLLEIFKSKKPLAARTIVLEPALVARASTRRNRTGS